VDAELFGLPQRGTHCGTGAGDGRTRDEGGGVMRGVTPEPRLALLGRKRHRFVTIRRVGTLTDSEHQLLALWAASCAEHVLDRFESARPDNPRPRQAFEQSRCPRLARRAAMPCRVRSRPGGGRRSRARCGRICDQGRTGCRAGRECESAGHLECRWQRDQLPEPIRELVLDDQRLRNDIRRSVFDC
jgi:hypothetical protein